MAISTDPSNQGGSAGRPFEALLFTNLADTSFRILPAVAQWCDTFDTRLTIVHTYEPGTCTHGTAETRLSNYYPEADRYVATRRRVVAGTPAEALRSIAEQGPVDMVMAPSGEPLGLPRLTPKSVRASLLQTQIAPVWTIGAGPRASRLGGPHRHVACCVLPGEETHANVILARQYAQAVGADLHIVFLVPLWPASNVAGQGPRQESGTTSPEQLAHALDATSVGTARRWNLLADLEAHEADILFVDAAGWWTRRRYWSRRTRHALDLLQRPIVCVSNAHGPVAWPLTPARP